jgi:hypothetical protein
MTQLGGGHHATNKIWIYFTPKTEIRGHYTHHSISTFISDYAKPYPIN